MIIFSLVARITARCHLVHNVSIRFSPGGEDSYQCHLVTQSAACHWLQIALPTDCQTCCGTRSPKQKENAAPMIKCARTTCCQSPVHCNWMRLICHKIMTLRQPNLEDCISLSDLVIILVRLVVDASHHGRLWSRFTTPWFRYPSSMTIVLFPKIWLNVTYFPADTWIGQTRFLKHLATRYPSTFDCEFTDLF